MLNSFSHSYPYYGNFNLFINFHERNDLPTCAVNVTSGGMNFYYNTEFLDKLNQKEVNFVIIHENFHLLWDHPKRTTAGGYDPELANIAQDMIINHIIIQDFDYDWIEIPKDETGKNMPVFLPLEYEGSLIFEELYEWLRERKEKMKDSNDSGSEEDSQSDGYGQNSHDPKSQNGKLDSWSVDHILKNLDKNYLDVHLNDEISQEYRDSMTKEYMERTLQATKQSRGSFDDSKITQTLNKLRKRRKDYLKYIKRTVSNLFLGGKKVKTLQRPNRRQIDGLKGKRKVKTKINCILDTSGSMGGTFERVLSYIYQNDIEINLIESDTNVKWVQNIKSKKQLASIPIKGLGGTFLQPAVDYVVKNLNYCNTLLITDGYCDDLDLSKLNGNALILTIGKEVRVVSGNGRVKQIKIDQNN